MCGLCGDLRFDGSNPDLTAIQRMAAALAPRGPDAAGVFAQGSVALGHRRLSILDLNATGQQPMFDPALGLAVVFNGCI
jgi:asparagine synthase (glutamine-hydrolysing)